MTAAGADRVAGAGSAVAAAVAAAVCRKPNIYSPRPESEQRHQASPAAGIPEAAPVAEVRTAAARGVRSVAGRFLRAAGRIAGQVHGRAPRTNRSDLSGRRTGRADGCGPESGGRNADECWTPPQGWSRLSSVEPEPVRQPKRTGSRTRKRCPSRWKRPVARRAAGGAAGSGSRQPIQMVALETGFIAVEEEVAAGASSAKRRRRTLEGEADEARRDRGRSRGRRTAAPNR